jgi:hypothetical protein
MVDVGNSYSSFWKGKYKMMKYILVSVSIVVTAGMMTNSFIAGNQEAAFAWIIVLLLLLFIMCEDLFEYVPEQEQSEKDRKIKEFNSQTEDKRREAFSKLMNKADQSRLITGYQPEIGLDSNNSSTGGSGIPPINHKTGD